VPVRVSGLGGDAMATIASTNLVYADDEQALLEEVRDKENQELLATTSLPRTMQRCHLAGLVLVLIGQMLIAPSVIATLSSLPSRTRSVDHSSLVTLSVEEKSGACVAGKVLEFGHSKVTNNNLAGKGPGVHDTEGIVVENVMPGAAAPVNLKIKVAGDSSYFPADVSQNGINGGALRINVKSGSQVDIRVQFVDANDIPVTLDTFFFSFIDLAAGETQDGKIAGSSQIIMRKYSKVFSTPGVQKLIPDYGVVEFQNVKGNDGKVTFMVEHASEFTARLSVTAGASFRNFNMVGKTSLVCE